MSHYDHDHHHDHPHHHDDHDHGHCHDPHCHDHGAQSQTALSFEGKLVKLFDHWIHHNEDHAENYREWAVKAKEAGLGDVGNILESAADLTEKMSRLFLEARDSVKPH